jgi:hypothetical protein
MPLLSTLSNAGIQSYGNRGIRAGGSAFFNAGGDYLAAPLSAAFTHTGNFTIELWVYPTNLSQLNLLWRQGNSVYMWINTIGQVAWYHGSNPYSFSAATVTGNQWNHIAVVRNSGTITIYINGVGSGSVFNTATVATGFTPLIGTWNGTSLYQFFGYITNVRVAKQALYTANFAPSGIPLTVNSQLSTTTQLLLNMRTASTLITDSSANNFALTNVSVTHSDFTPFLQPFVTPGTVVLQSATVTPTTFTPSEGTTITFNIVGTNTPNGTYYYTVEEDIATGAVTGADFTGGVLSGTFSISSNTGSFPLTVSRDLVTEGSEEFVVYVRKDSISGAILGTSGNITISDTSITPVFTAEPGSINEGDTETFTVANVGPDGTYFFTVLNGTSANADFSAVSGSFLVSGATGGIDNGTGSFDITTVADRLTEGSQTFQVQVRSGSVSGAVVVTSAVQTINDDSLTPAFTITPASINEGSSGSFTVNNLGPAGTYFWTVFNGTTTDVDFSAVSGSFTTSTLNGNGSFNITPIIDYVTEGAKTFQVRVRQGSVVGTVLVTSSSVTVNDTSTTVNAVASGSVVEGSSVLCTAAAVAFPNGTYYWTILNGTTADADFPATSGSFVVTNGTDASFLVATATDGQLEGAETFQVQIRRNSISGTVIATTNTITISANVT